MAENTQAPIIVKKVKKQVAEGGHHGGAWKVAYADFVTAMMAFFMLMWLLNATTEKQRKGLADYFNPTVPINRISGGGDGIFGGDSLLSEETLAFNGVGASQQSPMEGDAARGEVGQDSLPGNSDGRQGEDQTPEEVDARLSAWSGESMVSELLARHIVTEVTDEGLIIEIFDLPDRPLFEGETAEPTALLNDIIAAFVPLLADVENEIALQGFTASQPKVRAVNTVWQLSSDRANAVRVMFDGDNFDPKRIQRVTGFADREPNFSNPMDIRNNRIELILLRSER
ncbi:MAG: flagellar motor protein MotB [Pseudomonadota bacterium]